MDWFWILAISAAVLILGIWSGINAWRRWIEKMKWRVRLKNGATAHEIDRIARGLVMAEDAERAAARELVEETKGKRSPPGRFALWITSHLAKE